MIGRAADRTILSVLVLVQVAARWHFGRPLSSSNYECKSRLARTSFTSHLPSHCTPLCGVRLYSIPFAFAVHISLAVLHYSRRNNYHNSIFSCIRTVFFRGTTFFVCLQFVFGVSVCRVEFTRNFDRHFVQRFDDHECHIPCRLHSFYA